jgi:hypothetical protein
MFTEKDLRELVGHQSKTSMMSIYLNTDPAEGNADSYRLRLRNMLKTTDLSDDVARIELFFETEYDWSGKSVAVFSDVTEDFFRVFPLAVPVKDLVNVGIRPNVRPLAGLLDSFGGYGVVLLDKQGARLFHFHLGELYEQEGVLGELIKQVKTGGSSFGMRGGGLHAPDIDQTVEKNMRETVAFSIKFFEDNHIKRILLSGTDDNIALYKTHLPKSMQSLIIGTFPASMNSTNQEILNRAMEIGLKAEQNREIQIVDRLMTQIAKKNLAIVGLEPVLMAISEGRVQTLVIHQDYHVSGYRCPDCKVITSIPEEKCGHCDDSAQIVEDIVALAISLTLEAGGDVEVVMKNNQLFESGQIGAFLRY